MYIFDNENGSFINKDGKLHNHYEMGYNFSVEELVKIPYNNDYSYYGYFETDEEETLLTEFINNNNIINNTNLFDKIENIENERGYIKLNISGTINYGKKLIEIGKYKMNKYIFNRFKGLILFNERLFLVKIYSDSGLKNSLEENLTLDVARKGTLYYFRFVYTNIYKYYSRIVYRLTKNVKYIAIVFNKLDYYQLQKSRSIVISYHVLLEELLNDLMDSMFILNIIKSNYTYIIFNNKIDNYNKKNNKVDPCGCSDINRSITPFRKSTNPSVLVSTLIPSETGVVQEAGFPGKGLNEPSGIGVSALTTHMRHAPYGFIPG